MAEKLDLHRASSAEQGEAFRNFHDVWGRGLAVEDHVRSRVSNPKYTNAQWYVGRVNQRVVTACGCYSLELRIDGRSEPACALGEVHTLAEFRGRGYAPQLIAFVEGEQHAAGKTVSLLYSDIAPPYYERLGYQLCACPEGWAASERRDWSPAPTPARPVRFDPAAELSTMAAIYDRHHAPFPLWISRPRSYWQYLLARNPDDEFYFVVDDRDTRVGYFRANVSAEELRIRDLALAGESDDPYADLDAAIFALARARSLRRGGGWLAAVPGRQQRYRFANRSRELTMVKPFVSRLSIGPEHLAAGEHLHEIDHV